MWYALVREQCVGHVRSWNIALSRFSKLFRRTRGHTQNMSCCWVYNARSYPIQLFVYHNAETSATTRCQELVPFQTFENCLNLTPERYIRYTHKLSKYMMTDPSVHQIVWLYTKVSLCFIQWCGVLKHIWPGNTQSQYDPNPAHPDNMKLICEACKHVYHKSFLWIICSLSTQRSTWISTS